MAIHPGDDPTERGEGPYDDLIDAQWAYEQRQRAAERYGASVAEGWADGDEELPTQTDHWHDLNKLTEAEPDHLNTAAQYYDHVWHAKAHGAADDAGFTQAEIHRNIPDHNQARHDLTAVYGSDGADDPTPTGQGGADTAGERGAGYDHYHDLSHNAGPARLYCYDRCIAQHVNYGGFYVGPVGGGVGGDGYEG